jgi:bifunctional isochorismate lyase / aryl carrier protein
MSERRLPSIQPYPLPDPAELPRSRADWRLERERAALLIHDMQEYFVAAFVAGQAPIAPAVANLQRLAAAARAAGVPVFYTAQHGEQERRDRGLQADLWGPGMRQSPEHEPIIAELAPEPGDHRLVKHRYSAFQRSNLEVLLRARGRDQLVIGGVYAHIGCLFTAADAFQLDIQPFFAADALADFSRDRHDRALVQVADCCGVVAATDTILEWLR